MDKKTYLEEVYGDSTLTIPDYEYDCATGEYMTEKKHYHVPCNMPDCNIMFETLQQMQDHFRAQHINDPVNHPKHYVSHPSGIECIEVTRHYNFNIGNAMKYLWRQGLKDSEARVQDLQKAIWYIQDEIKKLESEAVENGNDKP